MDTATTRRVCGLDNPHISFWLCLLELLVMSVEVMELVRQDVSVRNKVKLTPAETFLHLDVVEAKSIFTSNFIALWEVVDSLELV